MRTDALTLRARFLLGAGSVLLLGGMLLGFEDVTRVGALLLALPVLALVLVGARPIDLRVSRRVEPASVRPGEPATVHLRLTSRASGRSPVLVGEEQLGQRLAPSPRLLVPALPAGTEVGLAYRVVPRVRGRHRLGPLTLSVRDPFDMVSRRVATAGTADLLVLPAVQALTGLPSGGSGVGREGSLRQHAALGGEDDVSLRDYRDGDDLRRIHWLATARTGELMVRTEERPSHRRAVLLVDAGAQAHSLDPDGSLEWACAAAASIGVHLAQVRYAVHLLTPSTCTTGRTQAVDQASLLEELALVEPTDDALARVLGAAELMTSGGGLLVAVLAPAAGRDLLRLSALHPSGTSRLALVVAPADGQEAARATTTALRTQGWSAVAVDPHASVPDAWADAIGANAGAVGGRPPVAPTVRSTS